MRTVVTVSVALPLLTVACATAPTPAFAPLAPQSHAEFEQRFTGWTVTGYDVLCGGERQPDGDEFAFIAPADFRYQETGAHTGTLTQTPDPLEPREGPSSLAIDLTFTSRTMATFTFVVLLDESYRRECVGRFEFVALPGGPESGAFLDGAGPALPPPEESLLWQYSTGNPGELVIVSPTVADGVVYAGSYENFVYALDAETGEVLWKFETESQLTPPPQVANGLVFVNDLGRFNALSASTGDLLWSDESFTATSQITDGTVYIPTSPRSDDFSVRAVDAVSGEQMWATQMSRSWVRLFFPLTLAGKNIYVSDDHEVHALDATTGELAWSFRAEAWGFPAGSLVQAPPTASGGKVYMMLGHSTALALDEVTGEPLWSYEPVVTGIQAYLRPPVVVDGIWYLVADELHALDAATGQHLWSFDVNYPGDSPVVAAGMVFVRSIFGSTYALDAANGALLWSLTPDWRLGSVLVVDGVLYANSLTGDFHTFDARTGEPIWSIDIGFHWFRRPFAVSDGVVYVPYQGTPSSGVYAFTAPVPAN